MAALALIVLALLAPATSTPVGAAPARPTAPGFPPEGPTRVLLLGDSVMEGAAATLTSRLGDRHVVVDTEVSRSTGATAQAAAGHGSDWDVVAILVAHNDGGSPGAYQPPYRAMLDQFAAVPRVVLLTLHEVRPYYGGVNQFLRDQAASRPNVTVADWNQVANANPGGMAGDGLHLNGSGAAAMADLVLGEVEAAEQAEAQRLADEAAEAERKASEERERAEAERRAKEEAERRAAEERERWLAEVEAALATSTTAPAPSTTLVRVPGGREPGAGAEAEAAETTSEEPTGQDRSPTTDVIGWLATVALLGGGTVALRSRQDRTAPPKI